MKLNKIFFALIQNSVFLSNSEYIKINYTKYYPSNRTILIMRMISEIGYS